MTQDERALLLAVAALVGNLPSEWIDDGRRAWLWQTIGLVKAAQNAMPKRE